MQAVHDYKEKECPRCHALFVCRAASVLQCRCSSFILTEAQQSYLNRHFNDCLCIDCLKALQLLTAEEEEN